MKPFLTLSFIATTALALGIGAAFADDPSRLLKKGRR
jgi:hypothetical protein